MANALIAFWDEALLNQAPFIHPRDSIPLKLNKSKILSGSEYRAAFEQGCLSSTCFHLGLLPQPYHGDIDKADILILLGNPGLSACDYHAEENYPEFRDELIASIRQERKTHLFLDPKWAWTTGFMWWERKLRDVAMTIEKHCDISYGAALERLASRVAAVELVPYHSLAFGGPAKLASTDAARRFVASAARERTIIATRSVDSWALPDRKNVIKYSAAHSRGASLGRNSEGGKAILATYGISS